MHYNSFDSIPPPKPFQMTKGMRNALLTCLGVGLITFGVGLATDPHRAWHNYLLNYFFWMSLGLGGVFFTALQHITGSIWSIPLRRVPESMVGFLPVAIILFLILSFGVHSLYEWTHADVVRGDPLLFGKKAYLNLPFFYIRGLSFLVLWSIAGFLFLRHSVKQDATGEIRWTRRNVKLAALFLLFFALSYTLTGFDLMMSLEPHWFSTIFGVYCFAGLFLSSLAMISIITIMLKKQGYLPIVNDNHLYDLGKLMFAFCVFWAYIAFSQFMLIWYGNLPEETFYMMRRVGGNWRVISVALLLCKFIIPFFLLLPAGVKRKENYLLGVSLFLLMAHWLDCYWMVFPVLSPEKPIFGWMELGIIPAFLGLFGLSVGLMLSRVPVFPRGDPKLLEGVNFHQS